MLNSAVIGPQAYERAVENREGLRLRGFELDDFDSAVARAKEMKAEVVKPRHRNAPSGDGGPNHWEHRLRDSDGYTVVLASPDGSAS